MDAFGSNATPMGGGAGRCDAMVGAVEAQKAEGVLHLHMFLFLQMVHQFTPLQEIADLIRAGILSSQSWKNYISHVRCASYPDAEQAEADRDYVERSWPAFAKDKSLSRLTLDLWISTEGATSPDLFEPHFDVAAWCKDGEEWHAKYNTRLQHALLHMNHHVHPVSNTETGERRVLASCRPKGNGNECKAIFLLDNEMTDVPFTRVRLYRHGARLPAAWAPKSPWLRAPSAKPSVLERGASYVDCVLRG